MDYLVISQLIRVRYDKLRLFIVTILCFDTIVYVEIAIRYKPSEKNSTRISREEVQQRLSNQFIAIAKCKCLTLMGDYTDMYRKRISPINKLLLKAHVRSFSE